MYNVRNPSNGPKKFKENTFATPKTIFETSHDFITTYCLQFFQFSHTFDNN